MIVTGSIWDALANNDFLTFTCDCTTPSPSLWQDHDIEKLDHDEPERGGRCLTSSWCATCGEDFCAAILARETHRDAVDDYRSELQKNLFRDALSRKFAAERANRRHLLRQRTGR
jgi:hypothetical protein